MEQSFIIKGDICHSKSRTELETVANGFLVCEGGVSRGVFDSLPGGYEGLPLMDYSGRLVVPGLVDLHAHAPQYAFHGLGMDLELLDWLEARAFPEEAKYHDLEYADRAYSLFVEALKRGPNTRSCLFATRHVPATLLLMDKLEASGLVTLVGKVNMDRNSPPDLREESAAASIEDTLRWLEDCAGRYTRTAPVLTPRFLPACSDGLMGRLREIQRRYALPVQSHLAENSDEKAWVAELCPEAASYSDAYHRFGLFGGAVPTVMAHCVWLDDAEMDLMAANGVFAAHCPQSNANLCSGIAPARRFLERGIRAGLGSDMAGGAHLSIFRAMSDAIQVSKLRWRLVSRDDAPLTLEEAFYLGTAGGGEFFGRVGRFDPGYELDALVIDDSEPAAPFALSIAERLARVVYSFENSRLRAKFVRGANIL